jgi:hypothetical protein
MFWPVSVIAVFFSSRPEVERTGSDLPEHAFSIFELEFEKKSRDRFDLLDSTMPRIGHVQDSTKCRFFRPIWLKNFAHVMKHISTNVFMNHL